MATQKTGNYQNNQPEAVHAGVNAAVFHISASVTISPGDTWFVGKLPVNAIPVDAIFYPAAQVNLQLGTSATPSLFFASATYSLALNRCVNKLGWAEQASLSDDKMPRYVNVVMSAAGGTGVTLGTVGDLVVYYKIVGQSPN